MANVTAKFEINCFKGQKEKSESGIIQVLSKGFYDWKPWQSNEEEDKEEKNVIMLYAKYDTECGFDKFSHYVSSEFSWAFSESFKFLTFIYQVLLAWP